MQKSASTLLRHQIRTFQASRNTTYRSFSTSNDNSLSGRRVFSSVPPVVAVYNDEEAFEEDVKVAFQQQQQQQAAAVAKKKSSKSVPHSNSCAPVVLHQLNDIQKVTRPSAQLLPDGKKKHNANVAIVNQETKELTSPSYILFAGDTNIPVTSVLKIVTPGDDVPSGTWPLFRLLDENGKFRDSSNDGYNPPKTKHVPNMPPTTASHSMIPSTTKHDLNDLRTILKDQCPFQSKEIEQSGLLHPSPHPFPDTSSTNTLLRAHVHMIRLRQMDNILQNAQRQGRISFYMTCRGEESTHIGSASALQSQDTIFAQYREQGTLMWRGFSLDQFTDQCFSNDADLGKGRQMPVHYGCRALNFHTISSPLGTQLPQAVGAAYKLKMDNETLPSEDKKSIAIAYFGDGCGSTTDFHSAMNFAATLSVPIIFFCRNNGYAISTPVQDQYAGDGIVSRGPAYGMASIRVDGNDIFAVHAAVREARAYALHHSAPVLIEAMTYRQGHHSTSDDSSRYRDTKELQSISDTADPLKRLSAFLEEHGWMDDASAAAIRNEERKAVLTSMESAEKRGKPKLTTLFEDVYYDKPGHLIQQERQLMEHIKKYPNQY
mmetsp:Transcript_33874/g.45237  ORF Transcript_33874/g.45237 Transcript_33874/m.45237 type:complete len:601 (+) Transcript_33874:440-2242(+)